MVSFEDRLINKELLEGEVVVQKTQKSFVFSILPVLCIVLLATFYILSLFFYSGDKYFGFIKDIGGIVIIGIGFILVKNFLKNNRRIVITNKRFIIYEFQKNNVTPKYIKINLTDIESIDIKRYFFGNYGSLLVKYKGKSDTESSIEEIKNIVKPEDFVMKGQCAKTYSKWVKKED